MDARRCCDCDASPGFCEHNGTWYLPPIRYERLADLEGGRPMWRAADGDRWRVEHPPSTWQHLDPASIDYTQSEPEHSTPVATATAEHVRQTGMRILGDRYRLLAERSQRRQPSSHERSELDRLERVIGQLEAMAPAGELQPHKTGGAFR